MREEYENWFQAQYGIPPMLYGCNQHDFCWEGYKAGQEALRQQLCILTKCKDCVFCAVENDQQGWCRLELPGWLRNIVTPKTEHRLVRLDSGCDFGKEKRK